MFNIKINKLKIPIYDIACLVSGFYVGYADGKGIPLEENSSYFFKYAPTAFSMIAAPSVAKLTNKILNYSSNKLTEGILNGNLKVTIDGIEKKYKDLSAKEKDKLDASIAELKKTQSKLSKTNYLNLSLKSGLKSGLETLIGYGAGRIYGQYY